MKVLILLLVCCPTLVLMIDCTNKPDGIYEPRCKVFVRCTGGIGETIECDEGYVYNSEINGCDLIGFVGPPCGRLEHCHNKLNGQYPDLEEGCTSYYTCNGGYFYGHNFCPDELLFNDVIDLCDWPYNVYVPCGTKPQKKTINLN